MHRSSKASRAKLLSALLFAYDKNCERTTPNAWKIKPHCIIVTSSDIMGLLTTGLLWDVWKYNTQWFEDVQLHLFNITYEWQHFSSQLRLDFFHLCINTLYLIFTWTTQITWETSFCYTWHHYLPGFPLLLPLFCVYKKVTERAPHFSAGSLFQWTTTLQAPTKTTASMRPKQ